jgi:transcriptional regulator with XRE-family HTH domain
MSDPSLGTWLRKERERREITLKAISDQTKVSVPLLEGLEADNLARWPDGIYRRAFVRSYATAVGLDPDEVCRRFEQEHVKPAEPADAGVAAGTEAPPVTPAESVRPAAGVFQSSRRPPQRARVIGTAADLTVALVLAMGSAAAGSRLLWPVLLIAAYYAVGILVTGTSPMVALLQDEPAAPPQPDSQSRDDEQAIPRAVERRHQPRRNNNQRTPRPARTTRPRVQ